ncbi:MAG: 4-alpha-glucanotransferase [Myxococcales bacterium]
MIRQALSALGVRRLVLAIHDQSFPSTPDEDIGRGSPYSKGARQLLEFVRAAGFDGVQLGPQGDTALDNPSPYDGALFSKSTLSIALGTLPEETDWSELCEGLLPSMVAGRPDGPANRARYRYAWQAAHGALSIIHTRFARDRTRHPQLAARFNEFRSRRGEPLVADGRFQALVEQQGTDDWRRWPASASASAGPGPGAEGEVAAERHAFGQFILAEQHRTLRQTLASAKHPLVLYGDLPIGFSHRDLWSHRSLFRTDYVMGAPPSRTNPDGQPWGFPVFDPDQYFSDAARTTPGPVLRLVTARVDAMLEDFDGLRIDHPHGLVCPWVYDAGDPDPGAAVSRGARLFCSPHLPDHPTLARLAIPTTAQLSADPGIARYADDWVRELREEQVTTYGVLFDTIMARVTAAGRRGSDVVCEVLSTLPYPLRRVMERHGLGRFRVLQKADLARPDDVYRAENAAEHDWIMLGNHDTRPIWLLAESWHGAAAGEQWARYLSERLMPSPTTQARLARWIAADARHLCQAMFAVLFACRVTHVSVFFADLFGMRDTYNRPGIVDADNWTLRLPPQWHAQHQQRLARLEALNVPLSLALALAGRGRAGAALVTTLLQAARASTPLLDPEISALISTAMRAGAAP